MGNNNGRITDFKLLMDDICTDTVEGKSLRTIAKQRKFSTSGFLKWLAKHTNDDDIVSSDNDTVEVSAEKAMIRQYLRAKEQQADTMAEMILEIVEKVVTPVGTETIIKGEKTKEVTKYAIGYNEARIAIDALKWTASKLKPKKYGERLEQHITGTLNLKPLLEAGRERLLKIREDNAKSLQDKDGILEVEQ